jgi:uncharacterized metal-binding protein YceD (DUF177 family)
MGMQFDLAHLGRHGRGPERVVRSYDPSAFAAVSDPYDYSSAGHVQLCLDAQRVSDRVYRVAGRVLAQLALECGRCLEPFQIPLDNAFELRYVPRDQNTGEGEREIGEDDLTTAYYSEDALDLEDLMREQFQLALPMKPLCSETCKGLCPECGSNRNTATCGCVAQWQDPRLGVLKRLFDGSSGTK